MGKEILKYQCLAWIPEGIKTTILKKQPSDVKEFQLLSKHTLIQVIIKKYLCNFFSPQVEAPPLSPFPSIKQLPVSPRRISQQHSLYVSPHKNGSCLTPKSALLYKFNGSPSKVRCIFLTS